MSLIDKIIIWFKNIFFRSYKSTVAAEEHTDIEPANNVNSFKIRNFIKDYRLNNITITLDEYTVNLSEDLNYLEEYIIESNKEIKDNTLVKLTTNIICDDGEIINNLNTNKTVSNNGVINITANVLGLHPITFSTNFDDFIPVNTKIININY